MNLYFSVSSVISVVKIPHLEEPLFPPDFGLPLRTSAYSAVNQLLSLWKRAEILLYTVVKNKKLWNGIVFVKDGS